MFLVGVGSKIFIGLGIFRRSFLFNIKIIFLENAVERKTDYLCLVLTLSVSTEASPFLSKVLVS